MGKRFKVSWLCVLCVVLALVSVATIVTLWTIAFTVGKGGHVTAPWDRYRLPMVLIPEFYNITLWPRLMPYPNSSLYIFTGE
ncbi:hypothetical protein AMECASPLE_036208 [Ameca splendens]|uniref:Uncharacterized protein n=1 Tax=Ameca splendens TaxID=208324 RepID=A0ABV0ZT78_9TELE